MALLGGVAAGLVVGLIAAGAMGIAIHANTKRKLRAERDARWPLEQVVVFANPVASGAVITFDDLAQRSVPASELNAHIAVPSRASELVGRVCRTDVVAGEPFRWPVLELREDGPAEDLIAACSEAARTRARGGE